MSPWRLCTMAAPRMEEGRLRPWRHSAGRWRKESHWIFLTSSWWRTRRCPGGLPPPPPRLAGDWPALSVPPLLAPCDRRIYMNTFKATFMWTYRISTEPSLPGVQFSRITDVEDDSKPQQEGHSNPHGYYVYEDAFISDRTLEIQDVHLVRESKNYILRSWLYELLISPRPLLRCQWSGPPPWLWWPHWVPWPGRQQSGLWLRRQPAGRERAVHRTSSVTKTKHTNTQELRFYIN